MSTKTNHLTIANIPITVVRKDIKHIHLAVYPPDGHVTIAAPKNKTDEHLRVFAIEKLRWIRESKKALIEQERQPPREYIPGESHYYLGGRYLLQVQQTTGKHEVHLRNNKYLELHVQNPQDKNSKERLLENWYREQLQEIAEERIKHWEEQLNVKCNEWRIKKMKTKWGTCNHEDKRVWLNLHLAKKSPEIIEYVILHELTHLIEKNHTSRFKQLLDKHMPSWKSKRRELNEIIYEEQWQHQTICTTLLTADSVTRNQ